MATLVAGDLRMTPDEAVRVERAQAIRQALDAHAIVSIADRDGTIIYVNQRFCQISGYSPEELIGRTHRHVRSSLHPPEFYRELWTTISRGEIWQGEICNRARNGRLYWVESTITPTLDAAGLPVEYISIRTDISRQKRDQLMATAIADTRSLLMAGKPAGEALHALLLPLLQLTEANSAAITEVLPDGLTWHPLASSKAIADRELGTLAGNAAILRALKQVQPVIDTPAPDLSGNTTDSTLVLPLLRGNSPIGLLVLMNRPGGFDADLIELLQPMTSALSGMLNSISLRRQQEKLMAALSEARDRAEMASRMKSEFFSRVSHELRTPLNAIIGFGQVLATDRTQPLSEDQNDSVDHIISAGQQLLHLVNGVIEIADLEAGHQQLNLQLQNLHTLVTERIGTMQPAADRLGVDIRLENATPRHVFVDGLRLSKAIDQVLDNALRFNHRGGQVRLHFIEASDRVGLVITDNGSGFNMKDAELIFQPFAEIHEDAAGFSSKRGQGIGLALTRRLLASMGARIEAQGKPGEGANFTLWFNLPPAITTPPSTQEFSTQ
jgi:PAS domain S-box-containing protein